MSQVASSSRVLIQGAEQPFPSYILRGHASQVSVIEFSEDGRRLYSGDIDGFVAVWNLRNFRPVLFWKAHEMGVLTLKDFGGGLLTHGRDNKIHHFSLPPHPAAIDRASAAAVPSPSEPTALVASWTMDVNAMAYCQMSLLRLPIPPSGDAAALVAVPSLTKDEEIDVFHLPSMARVHRALGISAFVIGGKTGTLMSVTIFRVAGRSACASGLHILAGYEDGRVALFRFGGTVARAFQPPTSAIGEAERWDLVWEEKGHREALMGLVLTSDQRSAWSVAADHYLCRYRVFDEGSGDEVPPRLQRFITTSPGRSAIDIRDDGKLIGVAGWDGEARLYSAKSGAPLAVLSHHRSSLHAIAFASVSKKRLAGEVDERSDSGSDEEESVGGQRAWMATGGKDTRISLWELYPPDAKT